MQTFRDVPQSHPFHADIEYVVAQGIVKGYSDGTFKPAQNITRGENAVMLARTLRLLNADEMLERYGISS